ncbi:MAG TPA: ATP-binding protein [Streptosporangiaceae bacterium]|nr:ATP-binding protein [Streptosporangiaceae bacterium]
MVFRSLTAGASAQANNQELSQRLVPAAEAASALLAGNNAESNSLRNYVSTGRPAALRAFRQAVAQMPREQARVAALVRGYPRMPGLIAAERAALRAWLVRIAGPQLAATARGDFGRARNLQGDIAQTRPYSLAARTRIAALQAQIISAQASVVAKQPAAQRCFLIALAVVCGVVAVIAAGSVAAVRRWLLRPFAALRQAAESVAAGQYDTPVPAVGPAELAELGRATERMRTRLVTALAEAEEAESRLRIMNSTLEGQVEQRTAYLEVANKNLAAFTYTVAHDLRTPLRAMGGFAEILAEEYGDPLGDTGRSYAGRIQAAAEHMDAVLDSLSHLSWVSQADINPQDVDLSADVTAVCDQLRARDPDHQVRVTIEDGIRVTADPGLIRMALSNLLANAWKYTAGRDDATIEFATIPATGASICCYVRDNGAGFDPVYIDKLFQPFQQLHGAAEYGGAGLGTGLAAVRRIIERHGGQIWAEGAVGRGATFYLTFGVKDTSVNSEASLLIGGSQDDEAHPELSGAAQAGTG